MRRHPSHTDPSTFVHQECMDGLCSLADSQRKRLFTMLCDERLRRKHSEIIDICDSINDNWSQTSYSLLLRFMGGTRNRTPFEELSIRVPYNIIMRENSSLHMIESLLFGASGLLALCPNDTYTNRLRQEFTHLSAKYSITPMSADDWTTTRIYPHSHPLLRVAQIAALLHYKGLSITDIANCTRLDDLKRMFATPPSEYWRDMILGNSTHSGNMGRMQSNILGINFVVPIVYAYGNTTQNISLQQRALALLSALPAEDNRYIRPWQAHSNIATSAHDSQALLQLSKEYCEKKLCTECPLREFMGKKR
jgi:hypothetical protein